LSNNVAILEKRRHCIRGFELGLRCGREENTVNGETRRKHRKQDSQREEETNSSELRP